MARCLCCNKYLHFNTKTGYCNNCYKVIVAEEQRREDVERRRKEEERQEETRHKAEEECRLQEEICYIEEKERNHEEEEAFQKAEKEWKRTISAKTHLLFLDAQNYFNKGLYDAELLKILQHVLILANEDTLEWQNAKRLYAETKRIIKDEEERMRKAEEERKRLEKDAYLKKIHIGLINQHAFFKNPSFFWGSTDLSDLRNYAFITMVDGHDLIMYFDDSYKGNVFFHINDIGKGRIDSVINLLRSEKRWDMKRGVGVAFKIEATKKGEKAIGVITLEDALSNEDTLQSIREMMKEDVNVYFFLMEYAPNLYERLFSGEAFEGVWKYKKLNEGIEITGTNLKLHTPDNQWGTEPLNYYFPSQIVFIPNYISGKPVTKISKSAFAQIDMVQKFVLPETVTEIGEAAFEKCRSLEEIKLPSQIKVIRARTFSGCSGLKSIILPDQLVEIGEMAFAGSGLEEITLPPTVKLISDDAFSNCEAIIKKRLK